MSHKQIPQDEYLKESLRLARRRLGRIVYKDWTDEKQQVHQFSHAVSLSDAQNKAYAQTKQWIKNRNKPLFVFGGVAGSGKTTTLGFLAAELSRYFQIAFCAPTGKASSVLGRSLRSHGVEPHYVGTIHRLMYEVEENEETGEILGWHKKEKLDCDLIIIDEASMVSSSVITDMESYNIPILAVGDHAQLPPVGEDKGIMSNPDVRLDEVRRQALDSAVVSLSVLIREGGDWRSFVKNSTDERVRYVPSEDLSDLILEKCSDFSRKIAEDPLLLCGTNKKRSQLNQIARICLQKKDDEPFQINDRVVCLKNSYLNEGVIANGFRGVVSAINYSQNPSQMKINVDFDEEQMSLQYGVVNKAQIGASKTFQKFTDAHPLYTNWGDVGMLFDYGNALTVHKSQGSQSETVIGVVERFMADESDFRRWLYTLVTRATQNLYLSF